MDGNTLAFDSSHGHRPDRLGHRAHLGAFGGAGHLLVFGPMIRGFIIALLLLAAAYFLSFLVFIAPLPGVPDPMPHADGIVALTGGDTRLDVAAGLLDHDMAKR